MDCRAKMADHPEHLPHCEDEVSAIANATLPPGLQLLGTGTFDGI